MSGPSALLFGVLGANLLGLVATSEEGTSSVVLEGIEDGNGLVSGTLDIDCSSLV